jgi:hypothetical protein
MTVDTLSLYGMSNALGTPSDGVLKHFQLFLSDRGIALVQRRSQTNFAGQKLHSPSKHFLSFLHGLAERVERVSLHTCQLVCLRDGK